MAHTGVHSAPSCECSDTHPPPPLNYAPHMITVIAAVLNGGSSRRMGTDKAAVDLAGRPLAEWVTRALVGRSTVFVGADVPGARSIEDAAGSGPLAGLAAALTLGSDAVFLVAVDQAWLRTETVDALVARFDGRPVVPVDDGTRQVTCAIYPSTLAVAAAGLAADGRALQAVLDKVSVDEVGEDEWRSWDEDGRSWFGVNSPDDLATGLQRFGAPGPGTSD